MTELDGMLTVLERLSEWEKVASPEELRAYVAEDRRARAVELVDALLAWRRLGGELMLSGGSADEDELPAARPALSPVVAPAVAAVAPVGGSAVAPVVPGRAPSTLEDEAPTERIPNGKPTLASVNLASPAAIAGLKAHVEGGGGFKVEAPAVDWPVRLSEQLRELLPARNPEADLGAVLRVVDAVDRWRVLPPEVQATLIGVMAARLRSVQEQPGFLGDRRIDFAFGSLSAYMKRARPGFVWGLARSHAPNRESWEADAEALYERLGSMLPSSAETEPNQERQLEVIEGLVHERNTAPEEVRSAVDASLRREVLSGLSMGIQARNVRLVRIVASVAEVFDAPEFRTLRRALRDEADDSRAEEEEEGGEEAAIPADWAWWGFTRGKRALLIGGDPREPNRVRLEKAFGFAELEWVAAEHKRNSLIGVRERVRAGKTDLVILLTRFTGHDADQIIIPACREMGVGFVCVQHGYGVVRVRHAVERFLDPGR